MPDWKVVETWSRQEDRGTKIFLLFGQKNDERNDLAEIRKSTENIFRQFNKRCVVKIVYTEPLSWAISVEIWTLDLWGYEQYEIMEMLTTVLKPLGNGEYYIRSGQKTFSNIWDSDKELVSGHGLFGQVPLCLSIDNQSLTLTIFFHWITDYLSKNFNIPLSPCGKRFSDENGVKKVFTNLTMLLRLKGNWLLRIICDSPLERNSCHKKPNFSTMES